MSDFDAKARGWDSDPSKVERACQIAQAILAQVTPKPDTTVLEYGCGTGLLGFALQPHVGHVTLADTSTEMLAVLREKIAASGLRNMMPVELDLTAGQLPNDRFGLVCTLMTLHHVADVDGLLRRFHSVLCDRGVLCISDLDREDGSFHGPGFKGHNGFDRQELGHKLEQAGFQNVHFTTAYEMTKATTAGPRRFTLFLVIADKA